jgi:hypothetical protein
MSHETNDNHWHKALRNGYEPDAVRLRLITLLVATFIVLGAVMHLGIWFLLVRYSRTAPADAPQSVVGRQVLPNNAPPLQPTISHDRLPKDDLIALRAREDRVLEHLGWKPDQDSGQLRPPDGLVEQVEARRRQHQRGGSP